MVASMCDYLYHDLIEASKSTGNPSTSLMKNVKEVQALGGARVLAVQEERLMGGRGNSAKVWRSSEANFAYFL